MMSAIEILLNSFGLFSKGFADISYLTEDENIVIMTIETFILHSL